MAELYGAAAEFLRSRFKGEILEEEYGTTVTTSASEIIRTDPDGLALLIVNTGPYVLQLSPETVFNSNRVIRLDANGGAMSIDVFEDGLLPTRAWMAQAVTSNTTFFALRTKRFISTDQLNRGAQS